MSTIPTEEHGDTQSATASIQHPEEDVKVNNMLTDSTLDVAKTDMLDKITIGLPGRCRLQRIFVRQGVKGGKTTTTYNPKTDAPTDEQTLSILPTPEEIHPQANTDEYLVVGIVLAKTPDLFTDKSTEGKKAASRDKQREHRRRQRGVLPAEPNIIRAIVPITKAITNASIKYYVACKPAEGICNLRLTTCSNIFFFPEIWDEVPDGLTAKERRKQLGIVCKKLAAEDQTPAERSKIKSSQNIDLTLSNQLPVTPKANAANLLLMQHSIYAISREPSALSALQKTVENILPDLVNKPDNEGVLAFFDFENILDHDQAARLIDAFEHTFPGTKLDPGIIVRIQTALCFTGLGPKLPYKNLAVFLYMVHDRASLEWKSDDFNKLADNILRDIEIMDRFQYIATDWTASTGSEDTEYATFLLGVENCLKEIVKFFDDQSKELREQYGGLSRYKSVDELMIQIGDCVDRTSFKSLAEQLFAIHVEHVTTVNSGGVKHIEKLIGLIDQILAK